MKTRDIAKYLLELVRLDGHRNTDGFGAEGVFSMSLA